MENIGRASSSRWNPTKEQITILEYLFKEGIHTPTVDQIEQIAGWLRQYGHIEGKNIFYWFQNYKARQRQKQKQERIAYSDRLRHKTSRYFYSPPSSNVSGWVSPYHLHHVGDYEKPIIRDHKQQASDITPISKISSSSLLRFDQFARRDHCPNGDEGISVNSNAPRTLLLFPLHPSDATDDNGSGNSSCTLGSDSPVVCFGDDSGREQPFIDFFSR